MSDGALSRTIRGFAYADQEIERLNAKVVEASERRYQCEAELIELLERMESAGLPPRIVHGNELYRLALREPNGEQYVETISFVQSYDVEAKLNAAFRRDTILEHIQEPATVGDL